MRNTDISVTGARKALTESKDNPRETLRGLYDCNNCGIDAVYTDIKCEKLVGCIGMKYDAPVSSALLRDKEISEYIESINGKTVVFDFHGVPVLLSDSIHIEAPDNIIENAVSVYSDMLGRAGKITAEGYHIIDLKSGKIGTHYDANLLIGNRIRFDDPLLTTPKSAVDGLGRGSFRAGEDRQVSATSYSLHPESNGEPSNRQFYLYEDGKLIFYSANVGYNVKTAYCTHMQNRTVIEYKTECGLYIRREIFILPQYDGMPDATEVQTVKISDENGKERKLRAVFTGMFGLCSPESMTNDVIYAGVTWESGVIYKNGVPVGLSPHPYPDYLKKIRRFSFIVSNSEYMDGYTANYEAFVGNGTLEEPQNGCFLSSVPETKFVPFFAISKDITVSKDECAQIDSFIGAVCCDGLSVSEGDARFSECTDKLITRFSLHKNTEDALCDTVNFTERFSSFLKIDSGDEVFDGYVNRNLPFQVYYQAYISRSFGWTQKAFRQTGFREIQDMYPSLYYIIGMGEYGLARSMLSVWAENVYSMGYANHNFYKTGKEAGVCSDDGLWLVSAVYRYISLSGDRYFLNKTVRVCGGGQRSILETLVAVIRYSGEISVGKHGLPLLDRSDWNDCLRLDENWISGPEKEKLYENQLKNGGVYGDRFENDLSESVMNAFLLKDVYDCMVELTDGELCEKIKILRDKLVKNIRKYCFINGYYVRALIGGNEKYKYLGSAGDGLSADENIDGTYYLNSFSWSVISGVATEDEIYSMLGTIEKYLLTDKGIMLCTPCALGKLASGTSASVYFPGDRENGGIFKHAEMMASYAMISASRKVKNRELSKRLLKLASFTIDTALPYKTLENPYIVKGNPRFCTQYTNSVSGESIGPMLSGTASWLALNIFNLLGINVSNGKISVSPVLLPGKDRMKFTLTYQKGKMTFDIKRGNGKEQMNNGNAKYDIPLNEETVYIDITV